MNVTTQLVQGKDILPHIDALAKLRIEIFKEYPYLYKGEAKYEVQYLSVYANSPEAFAILAWDGETLAGAATAIPMEDEMEELAAPVKRSPYPLEQIFYMGEVLFLPEYRGLGLGTRMLDQAEKQVLDMNRFNYVTCATVIRPESHHLRPDDFIPIDQYLHRNQYSKMIGVVATLNWPELDGISITHEMQYWIKKIS
ncbi:GNAT family N-acetyltransferase [Maridesulfovibrio sp. FT414]|uniref:GNAT family N-acetyltransferase n=1 Tax=Maridesulfovibrio sp. FT414 TaxID=2979469 RepID=UPI003D807B43